MAVIGWGATSEGGRTTPRLMEAYVTVQSNAQCEANYQTALPGVDITDNMWCAGEPEGAKDSARAIAVVSSVPGWAMVSGFSSAS